MDLGVEAGVFLMYAAAIIAVFLFGRVLLIPIKMMLKLMANSLMGGAVLFLLNVIGNGAGIAIPLNIITAVITGVLGLPGVTGLGLFYNIFA